MTHRAHGWAVGIRGDLAISSQPQHLARPAWYGPRGLAKLLLLGLAYFGAARAGLLLATVAGAASPVWPATGVALAGLFLLGVSRWPGIFVAACAVNLLLSSVPPLAALGMAVGNTLEAVLGVLLLTRLGCSRSLARLQDVLALTVVAALCTLASAVPGTLSLVLSGAAPWSDASTTVWVWWLGNSMGALVVGSAVLVLSRARPEPRWLEALVLTALTLVVGMWAFRAHPGMRLPLSYAQVFLLFPLGVWAALRFGPQGAVLSTLLVAALSLWGTAARHGPFGYQGRTLDLLELQLFLATVSLTGLLLAASRAERHMAGAQLELLATAVRSVREGVVISEMRPGVGPAVVFANESFREMTGWRHEELVGRSPREFCADDMDPETVQRVEAALRAGEFARGEVTLLHKDGTRVPNELLLSPVRDADGRVTHFVCTHRDITVQKQLQAKLVAAERIAAVGTLAAGVGHEINNPLAYLVLNLEGVAQSLVRGSEGVPEALSRLDGAREAAERIRVIVRDLKVFSRQEGE